MVDLVGVDAQHQQYLLGQSQSRSQVQRVQSDIGQITQKLGIRYALSGHHHGQAQAAVENRLSDTQGRLRTGKRQHHQAGMGQSGGGQGVEPTGIAIRHRRPHRTPRFDPLAVRFQQQMRYACQAQRSAQQQPDVIRPTDDHMVAQRPRPLGDFAFFGLRWLTECARAAESPRPSVMVSDQERCQPHAQHQRHQHRLHHGGGDQVLLHDHAQEQQRKLAAMTQHDACAPGVERRQAGCAQRQKVQPHLERHQGQQPTQYRQRCGHDLRGVQLQANGHEEQARQHITKGLEVAFHVVPEVALAQDHAGEKGPQGGGYADGVCSSGCRHDHAQGDQHEGFFVALPRHPAQQAMQQTTGGEGRCREQHQHAQHFEQHALDLRRLAARPDRQQGQQGHAGQVLKDQHGDGTAAVAGGELALVGQLSADQRRGRHGRCGAEQCSALSWLTQPDQHQGQWRGHDDHLQAAGRQYGLASEPEVPQREFQSDHEQQQGHTQFGYESQRLSRRDHTADRGAQQGADGEVTQQGGYSERRRRHHREAARRQQDQGSAEQILHRSASHLCRGPAHDVLRAHGACLAGDLTSALEQGERRNAADTELRGQVGLSLGVHLCQPDPGFELARGLLKLRRHHLARPAPGRPEIDQQRQIAALHVARERRRGQLDGLAREQGLLAAAAVGTIRELGGRHAVDGLAMWADDVEFIFHGSLPWTAVRLPRFGSPTSPTNLRL